MNFSRMKFINSRGGAAVEFAILLPVWLIIFFALLDYSWYLTNFMIMENAVSTAARAGVKVKYWSDKGGDDEDPALIAKNAVKHSFWLSNALTDENINVYIKDKDNNRVDESADYNEYKYLEVRVVDFKYPILVGYLSESMLPRSISAISLMAFP